MMTPTIHINGTSKDELQKQLLDAVNAIEKAEKALAKACPNGRDYYPQSGNAIGKALQEHRSRVTRLQGVKYELVEIIEAIVEVTEAAERINKGVPT